MFQTRLTQSMFAVVSVVALVGGCGSASSLTGQLSSLDPNMTLSELLSQMTLSDLVSGFGLLTSSALGDANDGSPPPMGEGHHPGDPNHRGGFDALNLTDEQETEANAIFTSEREDIEALHQDANEQIRALLTDEQLAQLDDLQPNSPNSPNDIGFHHGRHHGPPPCPFLDDSHNLTNEQKTAIRTILDDLNTAVEARREQARDEFRAILTEEQQAILDEMDQPPSRGGRMPMGSDAGPMNGRHGRSHA